MVAIFEIIVELQVMTRRAVSVRWATTLETLLVTLNTMSWQLVCVLARRTRFHAVVQLTFNQLAVSSAVSTLVRRRAEAAVAQRVTRSAFLHAR